MSKANEVDGVVMRKTCGMCKHIGERVWGLPDNEKSCKKLKDRQRDFDNKSNNLECVDIFRFRPTQGVLAYSEIDKCKHYEPNDA